MDVEPVDVEPVDVVPVGVESVGAGPERVVDRPAPDPAAAGYPVVVPFQ